MVLSLFQYDFMLRALAAGILSALTVPAIGMFLVVRRYSNLPDTLAHASLLGVAIGLLCHISPIRTALIVGILVALAIEWTRDTAAGYSESILTLFLFGSLGTALVIISATHGLSANLFSYLFGSITTVQSSDLWLMLGISVGVLGILRWRYRIFFLIALDPDLAQAHGIPVRRYHFLLVFLAALTIGIALQSLGALLIGALMVIPVLTALQLRTSFIRTLFFSIFYALCSVIIGLIAAQYFNIAAGGAIVVSLVVLFLLTTTCSQFKNR